MWTDEELEKFRRAGKIAAEVRSYAEGIVREGVKVLDICEGVEEEIRRRGAKPAFPCNVDVDWVAAHYTSPLDDASCIPPNSLVKVDVGVHVDGYIGDTAVTVCLNPEHLAMKQATDEALQAAIKVVKAGVRFSAVGTAVQSVIERYGFKVIRNLTGHGISRYIIHTGKPVPNISSLISFKAEDGEVCALEPFATTAKGEGQVVDGDAAYIYRIIKEKQPKTADTRKLFDHIKENYRTLPFAQRWIYKAFPEESTPATFERLIREKFIRGYPVLVEAKRGLVAQSEHTILVTRDGCEILTL